MGDDEHTKSELSAMIKPDHSRPAPPLVADGRLVHRGVRAHS